MAAPVKNSSPNKIIYIVIGGVVLLVVVGYLVSSFIMKKAAETALENTISSGTGGKVDVDTGAGNIKISNDKGTFEAGQTTKWPEDLPAGVLKFSGGQIKSVVKSNTDDSKNWNMIVSDVDETMVKAYVEQLKSSGFEEKSAMNVGVGITQLTKGNLDVNVIYDPSSKGVSITVSQKI